MLKRYVILGAAVAALLPAQAPDPALFARRANTTPVTPQELLLAFEAAPETDYRLGAGDNIEIKAWGRDELSGKHIVGPDGRVTLPISGPVALAGLTRAEAAAVAQSAWKPYYDALVVTVQVLAYESNRIFVLGRVANPGLLKFDVQPTLLEAVTRAGGLPVGGSGAEKAALTRCMVFRGNDRIAWIELKNLLTGANLALNIRLQRNDVVYIPDSDEQLVYVMGEVRRPGAVRLTTEMSFLDALAQAGGPTEDASANNMRLIRPSAGIDREIPFKGFTRAGADPDVALKDGDIVWVPKRMLARTGYLLQKVSPFTAFLLFGTALKQ